MEVVCLPLFSESPCPLPSIPWRSRSLGICPKAWFCVLHIGTRVQDINREGEWKLECLGTSDGGLRGPTARQCKLLTNWDHSPSSCGATDALMGSPHPPCPQLTLNYLPRASSANTTDLSSEYRVTRHSAVAHSPGILRKLVCRYKKNKIK